MRHPEQEAVLLIISERRSRLGSRLCVVGLVDSDFSKATLQLERKQKDLVGKAYEQARPFASVAEAADALGPDVRPQ